MALCCALLLVPMFGMTASAATVTAVLVNTQEWAASGVNNITVNYTSDKVYVLPSPTNQIILKEYSSHDRTAYYARTTNSGGTLNIQAGSRPSGQFSFYAEIYVPTNYAGTLNVTTTSGMIIAQPTANMSIGNVNLTANTGHIDVSNITANTFTLYSKSGQIEMNNVRGVINAETSSAKISVLNSAFSGSLVSGSARVEFTATELTGDLYAYSKSGKISAGLPTSSSFTLSAKTNTSSIANNWGAPFTFAVAKKHLVGSYGSNPTITVTLETNSTPIEINKN